MKLLVVSWGDFDRWSEVKYRFGDTVGVGRSTLPLLQRVIKPDWTVIVISDTLGRDFTSYEALKNDVLSRLDSFLETIGAGRELDVLIAPGVGHFREGAFLGEAMDAYYYILYRLSQILPPNENLEVHFDITHGINYLTFLVYRALRDLLGISAIANDVRLRAYNSDPYVRGISSELNINLIEDTDVYPSPLNRPVPGASKLLKPARDGGTSGKKLGFILENAGIEKKIREIKPWLDSWIGSVFFGLPLAFLEEFRSPDALEDLLENVVSIWNSGIEVSPRKVVRGIGFREGFATLVKAAFQMKVLERYRAEPPFTLEDLYEISRSIFRGSTRERAVTEIGKIEDEAIARMKGGETTDWIPLKEFLGFSRANVQVKPRNFLAHAGLEVNVTEVRIAKLSKNPERDAKKYTQVRYADDMRAVVGRIISKALREG